MWSTEGKSSTWRSGSVSLRKDADVVGIWSGSYGLNAKVNQSKKNLGAPPLPGVGWGLPREVKETRFEDLIWLFIISIKYTL